MSKTKTKVKVSYKDPWYVPNRYLATAKAEKAAVAAFSWLDSPVKGAGPHNYIEWFKVLHSCAYRAINSTSERDKSVWTSRWERVLGYLVEENIGLAYSRVRRYSRNCQDIDELESETMSSLYRAVCRFNPWLGWKFSTFACNVINNSVHRHIQFCNKRQKRAPITFESGHEKPKMPKATDHLVLDRLHVALEKNLAQLTTAEATVISLRFPLDGGKPEIFELIGARMGLCKERVRQIQQKALNKIKEVLEQDPVLQ